MNDYLIVSATNIEELQNVINSFLKNGWKCQGGVCFKKGDSSINNLYLQAVVR